MKRFLDDDFLLDSKTAVDLYQTFARRQPIIDYHCHLSPQQVADDHQWRSMTEIWLAGDHYKWRAMRTAGVPERNITGDASDWEKFAAWAATVPQTVRNPLYHWTHLELAFPFGVKGKLLGPDTAKEIYEHCNRKLAERDILGAGVAGAVRREGRLQHGRSRRRSGAAPAPREERQGPHALYPTWRPDKALAVHDLALWNGWVDKLGAAAEHVDRQAGRSARGAAEAARLLPRGRLPRVGPRPRTDLRGAVHRARGRGDLREGARAAQALSPDEIEKFRVGADATTSP